MFNNPKQPFCDFFIHYSFTHLCFHHFNDLCARLTIILFNSSPFPLNIYFFLIHSPFVINLSTFHHYLIYSFTLSFLQLCVSPSTVLLKRIIQQPIINPFISLVNLAKTSTTKDLIYFFTLSFIHLCGSPFPCLTHISNSTTLQLPCHLSRYPT